MSFLLQMAPPEGSAPGEPCQAGRGPVPAAVLPRRGRDGDLDPREAPDGHGRVLQGSIQHPGQASEAPGIRGGTRGQLRQDSVRHQDGRK